MQLVPAAQATHAPPMQTLSVPHDVPFGWFADSVQTDAPVAQEVNPALQGFMAWQAAPALQAEQVPPLHTLSVPQTVPF